MSSVIRAIIFFFQVLTWAIYHMAANEDVQEKVHEELKSGGNDAEDLQHCLYTRRVLDESLRISILAPFAARYQELECFLGNHHIPRGTPIIHALGVILHHPTFWTHPHKFVLSFLLLKLLFKTFFLLHVMDLS